MLAASSKLGVGGGGVCHPPEEGGGASTLRGDLSLDLPSSCFSWKHVSLTGNSYGANIICEIQLTSLRTLCKKNQKNIPVHDTPHT